MPRDTTTKYAVTIQTQTPGHAYSPVCWFVKRDGRPTDASLARYVESFEASTRPGGCNAHLGAVRVTSAVIRVDQPGGAVVARYQAEPAGGPLFVVVGGTL